MLGLSHRTVSRSRTKAGLPAAMMHMHPMHDDPPNHPRYGWHGQYSWLLLQYAFKWNGHV